MVRGNYRILIVYSCMKIQICPLLDMNKRCVWYDAFGAIKSFHTTKFQAWAIIYHLEELTLLHITIFNNMPNWIHSRISSAAYDQNIDPFYQVKFQHELEQLERLRPENTPRSPMNTYTIDSYQVPCQNKTSQSYKFIKIMSKIHFFHRWMDGRIDRRRETSIAHVQLRWSGGIIISPMSIKCGMPLFIQSQTSTAMSLIWRNE